MWFGEKPMAANTLGRQLKKRGIKPVAGRNRSYHGISLRAPSDDSNEADDNKTGVSVNPLTRAGEREVPENTVINRHPSSLFDQPDLDYYTSKHADIAADDA